MKLFHDETLKHCRWCGQPYHAHKPVDKDGFHSAACKQAHYRAFKKYVPATDGPAGGSTGSRRNIR